MKTVIIYGHAASGKTRNADALMKHFGCHAVRDDFCIHTEKIEDGALHLVTGPRPAVTIRGVTIMSIKQALSLAGIQG